MIVLILIFWKILTSGNQGCRGNGISIPIPIPFPRVFCRNSDRIPMGIPTGFPRGNSHRIPTWEFPWDSHMGIPTGFPWEFPQDSHVGIPIRFPCGNSYKIPMWEFPYGYSYRIPIWELTQDFHESSHRIPIGLQGWNSYAEDSFPITIHMLIRWEFPFPRKPYRGRAGCGLYCSCIEMCKY